jgi:hypothetical protein
MKDPDSAGTASDGRYAGAELLGQVIGWGAGLGKGDRKGRSI